MMSSVKVSLPGFRRVLLFSSFVDGHAHCDYMRLLNNTRLITCRHCFVQNIIKNENTLQL